MAVPGDHNMKAKEIGKLKMYNERLKLPKIWHVQDTPIPIAIRALGSISTKFKELH